MRLLESGVSRLQTLTPAGRKKKRVIKQLMVNNVAVKAYLSTGLAISLVRKTIAKCVQCVLRPVQGPDTEFSDPVTGRVFHILWESRLFVDFGNTPTAAIVCVVADHEIGFPLILGMDTLLDLGMQIIMNKASRMNPLYPLLGENWSILSTGLTMSMASTE
jgi:hypothetical protein